MYNSVLAWLAQIVGEIEKHLSIWQTKCIKCTSFSSKASRGIKVVRKIKPTLKNKKAILYRVK